MNAALQTAAAQVTATRISPAGISAGRIAAAPPRRRDPAIEAATRREFIALLAASGLLVACGGSDDDDTTVDSTAAGDTITVTNQFGTFEVPTDPQRVIGWEGRRDLETALALGLAPIAIGSNALYQVDELAPFIDFDLDGVEVIEQSEPNLELIAALRPDLILTRDSNIEAFLDELRPLAPLVPIASDDSWRDNLLDVADALARRAQADEAVAVYDTRLAEVRDRHADLIETATIAIVQLSGGLLYASRLDGFYLQNQTLADLGGRPLPAFEELPLADGYVELSLERIDVLEDADAILLIIDTDAERDELDDNPLWARLPAVTAGRVVQTDSRTNYGSVYAAIACADLLDEAYATLA